MLKILGSLMVILGSYGIGYGFIEKERKIIRVIERWEHICQMFISEVTYKKQPLALACHEIGEKISEKEGEMLKRISERMTGIEREKFICIWERESLKYCKEEKIPLQEQELIREFGRLTGFEDEEIQRKMIELQKEKWNRKRLKKQDEQQERKRLVITLSSCMGILLVLILW